MGSCAGEDMKRFACSAMILLLTTIAVAQKAPKRPKITGIDHVDFYTTDETANKHLYFEVLRLSMTDPVEPGQLQRFMIGSQWVGYSRVSAPKDGDRMDHLAFATDDCAGLLRYLAASGIRVPASCTELRGGSRSLAVNDPEGHKIEFLQPGKFVRLEGPAGDPISRRLIHAGIIVHERAAEDHFYKDILGFHLYWHGGMQPDRTDWVAMQVPDGTDWLEYMLNVKANPDLHTMGVMNHISLGVRDMKAA